MTIKDENYGPVTNFTTGEGYGKIISETDDYPMKYMHVEHMNRNEVSGIGTGEVYIFPKLDGTNCVIWWDSKKQKIRIGSRNRELQHHFELESDGLLHYKGEKHKGFERYINDKLAILEQFFKVHPKWILYGEFMKKHTISTYEDDMWGKFYIFDVYDRNEDGEKGSPLKFEYYCGELNIFGLDYIPPMHIGMFKSDDDLEKSMKYHADKNTFLMREGFIGEGVVAKRYDFKNVYGRCTWAKYVRPEFKVTATAPKPIPTNIEENIANKWCDEMFIRKEFVKYKDEFPDEDINRPRLIAMITKTFLEENIDDISRKIKTPIDLSTLRKHILVKIKENTQEVGW